MPYIFLKETAAERWHPRAVLLFLLVLNKDCSNIYKYKFNNRKGKQVKYSLLQGPVSSGFIFTRHHTAGNLKPQATVSSITHAIKTNLSKHQMNINICKGLL